MLVLFSPIWNYFPSFLYESRVFVTTVWNFVDSSKFLRSVPKSQARPPALSSYRETGRLIFAARSCACRRRDHTQFRMQIPRRFREDCRFFPGSCMAK